MISVKIKNRRISIIIHAFHLSDSPSIWHLLGHVVSLEECVTRGNHQRNGSSDFVASSLWLPDEFKCFGNNEDHGEPLGDPLDSEKLLSGCLMTTSNCGQHPHRAATVVPLGLFCLSCWLRTHHQSCFKSRLHYLNCNCLIARKHVDWWTQVGLNIRPFQTWLFANNCSFD